MKTGSGWLSKRVDAGDPVGAGEEAGADREQVGAEHQQRDGERAGNHRRRGPEPGQRRGKEQRAGGGEQRAGPDVAALNRGPRLALVLHGSRLLRGASL